VGVENRKFILNASIVLVRNPFDTIESLFNLFVTISQHESLQEWVYQDYKEEFDKYVIMSSRTYNEFLTYWIDVVKIPIFMSRYEDLMINQEEEILKNFAFLMELKDSKSFMNYTDEKELKERINKFVNADNKTKEKFYKPRVGKNLHTIINGRFTNDQLEMIIKENSRWLNYFDYFSLFKTLLEGLELSNEEKIRVKDFLQICEKYKNNSITESFSSLNQKNMKVVKENKDLQKYEKISFDVPYKNGLVETIDFLTPVHIKMHKNEKYVKKELK